MKILAIETSCDETSASVIEGKIPVKLNKKSFLGIKILSNVISSQIKIHAKWGGVVPNLAAREHLKNIVPVINDAIYMAKTNLNKIDLIAVTRGPGLIPALLIGTNSAKAISYFYKIPLIGIHHIESHIYANFIQKRPPGDIEFPILCLIVSGGHTQLVLMKNHLKYEIIGQTLDDAAGEAFDKVAKILGLGYPGGPIVSELAKQARKLQGHLDDQLKIADSKTRTSFPRPMLNSEKFNFSFSGLKTAVLYFYKKIEQETKNQNQLNLWKKYICKEFEEAAIEVLTKKTIRSAKEFKPKTILLAGGVAANSFLRDQLSLSVKKELPETVFSSPPPELCGDNAAMVGAAAFYRYILTKNKIPFQKNWKSLEADASMEI